MRTSTTDEPRLSTADCWSLLERERLGRWAVTATDGAPDIFPVNYVAFEGAIYIRTAPDVKLIAISNSPHVAFEVDGHDGSEWWSVVIRGTAERIRDDVEIERTGITRMATASPRFKQHVVKLTPSAVTGRRFAVVAEEPGTLRGAPPADASRSADDEASVDLRSTRPDAIPARRPREEAAADHTPPRVTRSEPSVAMQ
ncbi:pyridoxamine 5'-phosphate oxidase family protein [Microbacterium sp. SLBN-146]|uniref:pyridoxamine 5'-phosphate oxidase family protein n=1 Tax=Microbacterium sp. SLBN-146 TaxID=2768457 RepID=UPI0011689A6F|nr:pyridoxamine 5'-phosphate oxidase family protein [Microbacterium sp. SLBN-146]TQJ31316.1 pyridoxamine 5'-phosphate oxidase-like protein [Microbacterium sp. SLBN-146]